MDSQTDSIGESRLQSPTVPIESKSPGPIRLSLDASLNQSWTSLPDGCGEGRHMRWATATE